jgi:hypothetical protein
MPETGKITLGQVGVVIIVGFLLVGFAGMYFLRLSGEGEPVGHRPICMSNLKSIGSALTLYKGSNDSKWPWMPGDCTGWETNPVGLNRELMKDPNTHPERSITALMFMLVRDNQPAKLFVCPSSVDTKDENIKDTDNAKGDEEGKYFWDFSNSYNVSYSWQGPIKDKDGKYRQGLNDNDNDTVVIADKTPRWGPQPWNNTAWDPALTGAQVQPHMSQNHSRGKVANALFVGINVNKFQRPDIGIDRDMIYTASGDPKGGSQKATSISLVDHLSTRNTFLIGPVPGPKESAEAKGK